MSNVASLAAHRAKKNLPPPRNTVAVLNADQLQYANEASHANRQKEGITKLIRGRIEMYHTALGALTVNSAEPHDAAVELRIQMVADRLEKDLTSKIPHAELEKLLREIIV